MLKHRMETEQDHSQMGIMGLLTTQVLSLFWKLWLYCSTARSYALAQNLIQCTFAGSSMQGSLAQVHMQKSLASHLLINAMM